MGLEAVGWVVGNTMAGGVHRDQVLEAVTKVASWLVFWLRNPGSSNSIVFDWVRECCSSDSPPLLCHNRFVLLPAVAGSRELPARPVSFAFFRNRDMCATYSMETVALH